MSDALRAARAALGDEPAWLVGGAVRDRLLGRAVEDLDLAVAGDAEAAARRLGRAVGGPVFPLSEAFGAWRVIGPDRRWHADVNPLRGQTIEGDLAVRDFTVNAMAEPLGGGEVVDPHGGREDLAARRLRMVSAEAFADDPLRVVRLARLSLTLGFTIDEPTAAEGRRRAGGLAGVAGERVLGELRHVIAHERPAEGIAALADLGALAVVLPEVDAMRGVEQTVYHHRDAYGHTLEVLEQAVALESDPEAVLGAEHSARVRALLAQPLADDMTRGHALRLGALLHDAAKPATQTPLPRGGYGFPGHDVAGAEVARDILARLRASERLRAHVSALARHHLRLGFLVHERPVSRRAVFRYLVACDAVAADVTLLSVADRLATRGRKAEESIARHLELARQVLGDALDWQAEGPPRPLLRGDDVVAAAGIAPGPEVGRLLGEVAEAQFAGELGSREEALDYVRSRAG